MKLNNYYFAGYSLSSTNAPQVFIDLTISEAMGAHNR
jgi:hypothetical protein